MSRALIDDRGRVRFGIFREPIDVVNHKDCQLIDEFDRPLTRWRRYWAWNQFEFMGGLSDQLIFGCALANVRYAGTVFAYVYLPQRKVMKQFRVQRPFGAGVRLDLRPEDGQSEYRSGSLRVEMTAGAETRFRRLRVEAPGLAIDAEFDEGSPLTEPMRICTPAGAWGWVFARKTAGQAVCGEVLADGERFDLEQLGVLGHRDWTAGYMRRETFWNWGCLACRLPDGSVVGLNVSCGVNETSFTENCFWHNGRMHKIGTVAFTYDRTDLLQPWHMTSSDGRCDLAFVPKSFHRERTNLGIVAINLCQLIGRYEGRLRTAEGVTVELAEAWGYAEWHYAKW